MDTTSTDQLNKTEPAEPAEPTASKEQAEQAEQAVPLSARTDIASAEISTTVVDQSHWVEVTADKPEPMDPVAKIENQLISSMTDPAPVELHPLTLRGLRIENFMAHDHIEIDFSSRGKSSHMSCFIGPNGSGKTTVLSAIQLLFMTYGEYGEERYQSMMLKNVRNWQDMLPGQIKDADFKITGTFHDGQKEYDVSVSRLHGYTQHPPHILENLSQYCFLARFDQELNTFQIARKRWEAFQKFFSQVTGFTVEEDVDLFSHTSDVRFNKIIQQYVTGFLVKKPRETIKHRQCSAGERKIAKCFSTILNRPMTPRLILVDNITDHVENPRHISVVEGIEECFPESQLVVTCHSIPVQRNMSDRSKIIDMRFLYANDLIQLQPWRMRYMDELADLSEKMASIIKQSAKDGGYEDEEAEKKHLDIVSHMVAFSNVLSSENKITSTFASGILRHLVKDVYNVVSDEYRVSFPVRIRRIS